MNPERWRQISAIFQAAIARPPAERAPYLDEACRGDEALRKEVVSLMEAHGGQDDFLELPILEAATGAAGETAGPLAPGDEVGPYCAIEHLGSGGMGAVYLAEDSRLRRRVALKVLPAEFCADESRVRRFEREARAASSLNHPNIMTVYEFGQAAGLFYMAAEYVEGRTLRERMKDGGALAAEEALGVAAQVADALAAAHEAGIVHRDVKPENVILRADGRVKVLDFGLAKFVRRPGALEGATNLDAARATLVTSPHVVMGTVRYMSPEQVRGQEVDGRADVWSLGCVLHEMLTGEPAFDGPTPADALAAVIGREYEPPAALPSSLQKILSRALAKERAERFASATALADEIRAARPRVLNNATAYDAGARSSRVQTAAASNAANLNGGYAGARTLPQRAANDTGEESARTRRSFASALDVPRGVYASLVAALALALGVAAFRLPATRRLFGLQTQTTAAPAPQPFQTMRLRQLTDGGAATDPAISPDGKLLAYISPKGNRQVVSVREVAQASEARVVSPEATQMGGLVFSHDGASIYYLALDYGKEGGSIYRVPVGGGEPQMISQHVLSHFGLSPDGQHIAFIRQYGSPDERQSLIVCDAEGRDERELLAKRGGHDYFNVWGVAPAWSPDGARLAVTDAEWSGSEETYHLSEVSLADGSERRINAPAWQYVDQAAWTADGGALVVLARENTPAPVQVWLLDYPTGAARRVTNDLDTYTKISLTADSRLLVAARRQTTANVWVVPNLDSSRARQITSGEHILNGSRGMDWLPDGRLAYVSAEGAMSSLWLMDADGSNRRPLVASDEAQLGAPFVTADGREIIFSSTRGGGVHVWSVPVGGGEPRRLTDGVGEDTGRVSPDGRWLLYAQKGPWPWSLWRKPMGSGEPQKLTDGATGPIYFSPDDGHILTGFYDVNEHARNPWKIALLDAEGGPPLKLFQLPAYHAIIAWSGDGGGFYFISTTGTGAMNIYLQPLGGSTPRQVTHFSDARVFNFALSRDGSRLAVALGNERSDAVMMSDFR